MKNTILGSILMIFLLSFSSCASRWSSKTCTETNFGDLGYQEGSSGKANLINSYNQACLKKKVQIPIRDYKIGYQKGLLVFCSPEKGFAEGSKGQNLQSLCGSTEAYTKAYKKGLRGFCSTAKGVQDGFAMRPEIIVCTSFSSYTLGYKKGKKEYCTSDRGQEHGFAGEEPDSRCIVYPAYKTGYSKGQVYFCSIENGAKLGEKGAPFPDKCMKAGLRFKSSYNKGRVKFLTTAVREKRTGVTFERQNYERIRDELQDMQFALGRFPKHSIDPNVDSEKVDLMNSIQRLRVKRDQQRDLLEGLESEIYDMENEIRDLKQPN